MKQFYHLLLEPLLLLGNDHGESPHRRADEDFVALSRITHALKSYTAKRANKVLRRTGAFWQEESYDHWARDEKEFGRIVEYIENNPVKAGLVDAPEKWTGSSAAYERGEDGTCLNRRCAPRAG